MKSKTRLKRLAAALGFVSLMTFGGAIKASAEDVVLHMAVPDWPPTRIMKDMFDKEYKSTSGNKVTLDLDFIPWPDFYTRVNASLTSGEKKYNMAVSDSQWLGAFIEGGYFRKINDLIDADPDLKKAMDEMHPAVLNAYATYPYTSKNFYGFPQFPDILVSYARKDIFCNDEEQKNFKAKYNKKLPCTGEEFDDVDWQLFENIGAFFMRKKGDMLAGKPAKLLVCCYQVRSAKAMTSQPHRSIRSFGRLVATSGMKPKFQTAMPRAWSTLASRSRPSIIC